MQKKIFHWAGAIALSIFKRRARHAIAENHRELKQLLTKNKDTEFGRAHDFQNVSSAANVVEAFRYRVPLSSYTDYLDSVTRIAKGVPNILTAEPVTAIVGSAGTTGVPKRIPRTRSAQRKTMFHVVLAEQGVLDRGIAGARQAGRGISLMSTYMQPADNDSTIPFVSGPNAGMARVKRQIPVLWTSPPAVFDLQHQPSMFYLHALFGLLDSKAAYISIPFAPQLVAWFNLLERYQTHLIRDIACGTLSDHLELSPEARRVITGSLKPDPYRAKLISDALAQGMDGIIPRLWPQMKYLRTVTSGSFALSEPRLRRLAGKNIVFYSGCHSSSEGILGINLRVDGSVNYVLTVGSAFFEFLPLMEIDSDAPVAIDIADLCVGSDYELVISNCAGLYRYRMGDIIRIIGWQGQAPIFNFLYRRGTILNLVGEKTTEYHTSAALVAALTSQLAPHNRVLEYSVDGAIEPSGQGRYIFYVELEQERSRLTGNYECLLDQLDETLAQLNPYYASMGRSLGRLAAPAIKFVRSGAFAALLDLQRQRCPNIASAQLKVPRAILTPEYRELLELHVESELSNSPQHESQKV